MIITVQKKKQSSFYLLTDDAQGIYFYQRRVNTNEIKEIINNLISLVNTSVNTSTHTSLTFTAKIQNSIV